VYFLDNTFLFGVNSMRKSILSLAVLSALAVPSFVSAEEVAAAAPAEAKSAWTASSNVGFVSDYYTRGISQSWHKPAIQGGIDFEHTSGFYAGVWGSSVTPNTFPDASVELDAYFGYNGEISAIEGLGYTVGAIGYFYPGGDWKKCTACTKADGTTPNSGGRWDTYEANFGLSYKWISAKASVTLGDWFGAEKGTGFKGGSSGTTYIELNAAYPLPWYDLTLVGHVGHLDVSTKLADGLQADGGRSPDYTDYKVGLSKSFSFANSEGWDAGLYYVGASDNGYWGKNGFGGPSFNGSTERKDLSDNRWIVSLSRSF
jgi:uncharacterized protein (TIGR02001 family)